jgi:hypothetical protein
MDRSVPYHKGLESLLELDGWTIQQAGGYWVKFEISMVEPGPHIPHGIKYCLSLHDKYNQRVMGFDNAHLPKQKHKKFSGRIRHYDHQHTDIDCRGVPYSFSAPEQLLIDFWCAVDDYLKQKGVIDE